MERRRAPRVLERRSRNARSLEGAEDGVVALDMDTETASSESCRMEQDEEFTPFEFSVPGTVGRRLGEFGVGLLWALYCLMILFPPSHQTFMPWLTAPLTGLASFHFIRRAFDGRPRLIVDKKGITDRTSIVGGALHVPWEDVLSVSVSRFWGTVDLEVRDLAHVRRRASVLRRAWMLFGRLLGRRAISVSPTLLGLGKMELKERLDAGLLEFERSQLGLPATAARLRGQGPEPQGPAAPSNKGLLPRGEH